MIGARFIVSGKVQGVWFRASTCDRAQTLGLRGIARNLDDGSVEVLAFGSAKALVALEAWLAVGPPQAKVERVLREAFDGAPCGPGFGTE